MQNREVIDCPKCGAEKGTACRTPSCEALKTYQAPDSSATVVKPFTPADVVENKKHCIPDEVIEAVNELLTEKYVNDSRTITIKQKEIVERVLEKMPHLDRDELFSKHYMDFEPVFRENGWDVYYDSPAYCESYDAYFKFTAKRGQR